MDYPYFNILFIHMLRTSRKEDLGTEIEWTQVKQLLPALPASVVDLEVTINEIEQLLNNFFAFLDNRKHAFMISSGVVEKWNVSLSKSISTTAFFVFKVLTNQMKLTTIHYSFTVFVCVLE